MNLSDLKPQLHELTQFDAIVLITKMQEDRLKESERKIPKPKAKAKAKSKKKLTISELEEKMEILKQLVKEKLNVPNQ